MKDTDQHIRHLRSHCGGQASARRRGSCALRDREFGRGGAPNKKIPSVRAVRIWSKQLKKVGITYFSFVFSSFFSL